jgi:hypothetical protein
MPKTARDSGGDEIPPAWIWKGAGSLKRLYALNERCLEALVQLSRADRERVGLAIVNQHRRLWRCLGDQARARAARTPFAMLDARFHDPAWWRAVVPLRKKREKEGTPRGAFGEAMAIVLMRETLTLAWSTANFDRTVASVLFGMASAVAEMVVDLSPQDIERIAMRHHRNLQPRWADSPSFWGRLLGAAQASNSSDLQLIRLQGLQLIGRDVVPLAADGSEG